MTQETHKDHKLRDLLLYCVIGILVSFAAVGIGFYQAKKGLSPGGGTKWIGFAIMTLLLFLNLIRSRQKLWNQHRFWLLLTGFAIAHLTAGIALVSHITNAGLIEFAACTLLEFAAADALFRRFLPS
jgi:hypothetical protein